MTVKRTVDIQHYAGDKRTVVQINRLHSGQRSERVYRPGQASLNRIMAMLGDKPDAIQARPTSVLLVYCPDMQRTKYPKRKLWGRVLRQALKAEAVRHNPLVDF